MESRTAELETVCWNTEEFQGTGGAYKARFSRNEMKRYIVFNVYQIILLFEFSFFISFNENVEKTVLLTIKSKKRRKKKRNHIISIIQK